MLSRFFFHTGVEPSQSCWVSEMETVKLWKERPSCAFTGSFFLTVFDNFQRKNYFNGWHFKSICWKAICLKYKFAKIFCVCVCVCVCVCELLKERLEGWFVSLWIFLSLVLGCLFAWASQVALVIKNQPANAGDLWDEGFNSWVGKIPWRRAW